MCTGSKTRNRMSSFLSCASKCLRSNDPLALHAHRHAQESRRNRSGVFPLACVLANEESLQLFLQFAGSAVLVRRFERIDRGSVVAPESLDEGRGRSRIVEGIV